MEYSTLAPTPVPAPAPAAAPAAGPVGPGLYTEIGKKAMDLLYKDYQTDHKFTLTTTAANGAVWNLKDSVRPRQNGTAKESPSSSNL